MDVGDPLEVIAAGVDPHCRRDAGAASKLRYKLVRGFE
jgi:hypothetical protein